MNKIIYFFLLFLVMIGIVGGIGYTIYYSAYIITAGLVATAYVAWPGIRDLF